MQTVRKVENPVEAEIVKSRLETAGIFAVVIGAEVGTMLSHIGSAVSNIRVEVASDDLEKAHRILEEDERQRSQRTAWKCSRCDEPNEPLFDVCWACNKERTDSDPLPVAFEGDKPPESFASPSVTVATRPVRRDANPYAPPGVANAFATPTEDALSELDTEHLKEVVSRVFRGAVICVVLIPPLITMYVLSRLIFEVPKQAYQIPGLKGKLIASWCLCIASFFVSAFYWAMLAL